MPIRKTSQEIREEILTKLNSQPLSVEQLRKEIKDSNWSTINKYLEELKEEGNVREIISTEKIKVYQRVMGDTYFELPITDTQRKKFRTLFHYILQEYKSRKQIPTKTHFAKCAVHVIKNDNSGLSDLPTIWYLYGMIPQMVADPSQDYQEEFLLKHKVKIQGLIKEFISKNGDKKSRDVQKEQHEIYGEELYCISDRFFDKTNKYWNDGEVLNLLNKFFIACPIDDDFPEVFEFTEDLFSLVNKLSKVSDLKNHRNNIVLSFHSLWKYIALYKLYQSKITGKNSMPKGILLNYYLRDDFESRKDSFIESFSELKSAYLDSLIKFNPDKIELSEGSRKAGKIMEDWIGED